MQSEGSGYWGIGLVRRIVRDAQQQRHVGIQVLTTTAIPIKISMSGMLSFVDADRESERAILLSTGPDSKGEVGIVLRSSFFNGRDRLDMTVYEKSYQLTPVGLVESNDDFDWVKFKAESRSDAGGGPP
jgi:hypothetical protein